MAYAIFIFDVGEIAHRLRRAIWPVVAGTPFGDTYSLDLLIEEWFRHFFYKSHLALVDKDRLSDYPANVQNALYREFLELEPHLYRYFSLLPAEFRVQPGEMRLDDDSLYLSYFLGDSR